MNKKMKTSCTATDKSLKGLRDTLKTARYGNVLSYPSVICITDYFALSAAKKKIVDSIINQLVADTSHYINGVIFEKRGDNLGIHH